MAMATIRNANNQQPTTSNSIIISFHSQDIVIQIIEFPIDSFVCSSAFGCSLMCSNAILACRRRKESALQLKCNYCMLIKQKLHARPNTHIEPQHMTHTSETKTYLNKNTILFRVDRGLFFLQMFVYSVACLSFLA